MNRLKPYRFLLSWILHFAIMYSFLFFPHSITLAQKNSVYFKYYTVNEGLSQNTVQRIFKDSKGFMWFGTWNGLNRFDGYEFTVYKHDKSQKSLSGNFIYSLEEDHFGNIWIGTDNGLNVYLYENDQIIRFDNTHKSGDIALASRINVLMRDQDNLIWMGTESGIVVFDVLNSHGELNLNARYTTGAEPGMLSGNNINAIYKDSQNRIWVGTNSGLNLFNRGNGSFTSFQSIADDMASLSNNIVNTIYQDQHGDIWVGTYFGLNRLDMATGQFTWFHHNPADPKTIAHSVIRDITEDMNGRLTVATLGGISLFQPDLMEFENIKHEYGSQYGLNNEFLSCIYSDDEGNVWIGTEKGGINRYNVTQKRFTFFEKGSGGVDGINHNTINALFEDKEHIWIGTAGGGLNSYHKESGRFRHFVFNPNDPSSLNNNFISALFGASDGHLYVGAWGGGLHRLRKENTEAGIFDHYPIETGATDMFPDSFIADITEDTFGNLWIASSEGISRMNIETGEIKVFSQLVDDRFISSVGCVQFDKEGNLWAGTQTGLYKVEVLEKGKIDMQLSNVIHYMHDPKNATSIPGNFVTSILLDQSGSLWIGTYGNGFARIVHPSQHSENVYFKNYTETDGLSNNVVFGILDDNFGNLWLTTDFGLSRFNINTETFKNYYHSDGLRNDQYYWSAAYRNDEGMIYVGGMNGLNYFFPDSLTERTIKPKIVFTDLRLNNRPVLLGKKYIDRILLEKSIMLTDEITFPNGIREFSIFFSALLYDQPYKVQYAYKMVGFDKDWTYVDASRRFASYMNMRGGNYQFMVKATDSENNWSSEVAVLNIRIIPPFYARIWFIGLVLLLLIGSIITYNRYKLFIIRLQKRKLEERVKLRTSQIMSQKETLLRQAKHLRESLEQLEKRRLLIEEQKQQLESKSDKIKAQRDKLAELHKKLHTVNQQQLSFFTNISHEFRTPLTLILAPLEQLLNKKEIADNTEVKYNLGLIQKNTGRLLRLINQLMDVRKIDSGKKLLKCSEGDIISFTKEIFHSFTVLAEKQNIRFVYNSSAPEIIAIFDWEKTENIIYNLLYNAFKYTPDYGKIEFSINHLETVLPPEKDDVHIVEKTRSFNGNGALEIIVSDTGIGILPENIKSIFNKFSRIPTSHNNAVRGTGIGLYLTRELIRLHKGALYVKSVPGKGTSLRVLLPFDPDEYSPTEIITRDGQISTTDYLQICKKEFDVSTDIEPHPIPVDCNNKAGKGKPHILVVEDDDEMRTFISHSLSANFNIEFACNGFEGLELARDHAPDLVLSDIMMPKMDGLELCQKLKSDLKTSHIPVILLTARSDNNSMVEGLETGADDYVPKPFNLDILKAKIKSIIENRKRLRKIFRSSLEPIPKGLTSNTRDMEFLQKAVKLIEENLSSPELNVNMLAIELCVSRSLLHKKLTAIAGQSTNDFITSIRLKKSARMLREGKGNVTEVAYEVGFNDPKYFSRCFKKHFNLSPTEYLNGKATSSQLKVEK
jgi:ligand-binding sensor domain-containing protein/signal transduction histidine kinase/DNA-binding response OmpR family regulator